MATKPKKKSRVTSEGYIARATLGNVRISPQKARLVVDMVRGQDVASALRILTFCDKKAGPVLKKLLVSAVANATDRSQVDVDELYIKTAYVNAAKTLKRFMPRAQGRATPIRKRSSSITFILDEM